MKRRTGLFGLALLAGLFWVYGPALRGGMLWDDDAHVTRAALRSWRGLGEIWFHLEATQQYYPVLHTAFWVEHRLWGDAVLGYHLISLAWHAGAAVLLLLCLRRLGFSERAAWLGAGLWAFHPVVVESVAWISEQKNTLSALGYFGAGLLYLRYAEDRRRGLYAAATAVFVLAVLTKTVTGTLPAALLVVLWWRGGCWPRRDAVLLLPWLAWSAACGGLTAWVERHYIGAEGAPFALSLVQRLALCGKVIVFYLGKIVWPRHVLFIYPRWNLGRLGPVDWLPLAATIGVLALLCRWAARGRRAPLAAALLFIGTLFPALGFVNVYPFLFSYVADHFQYLACASVLAGAGWLLARVRVPSAALALLPALLAWRSHALSSSYRDAETLYRRTLAGNPDAWLAHFNLGVLLGADPARRQQAIAEYRAALRLNPGHWAARNNLGELLVTEGDLKGGIAEYEAALRLRPAFAEAHNNLGVALARLPGRVPDAIAELRAAIRLRPDYDAAHANLGGLLLQEEGGASAALAEYRAAVDLAPASAEYRYDLGNALLASGQPAAAVAAYRQALELDPNDVPARANLASVLARQSGTRAEAFAEYRRALALAPGDESIHFNFGNALLRDPRRLDEAAEQYRACVRLKPDDAVAHVLLAVAVLRSRGSRSEAVEHLQIALRLRPDLHVAEQLLERLKSAPQAP